MRRLIRSAPTVFVAALSVLAIGACGSSKKSSSGNSGSTSSTTGSSGSSSGKSGGTIQVVQGVFPQSTDPGLDFTTQGAGTLWLRYIGLYTYKHANGTDGTQLIPGLATSTPTVTDGGKTYTVTMKQGMKYDDGTPIKASDVKFAIERSLKLGWSAASFVTSNVVGAKAYSKGKAKAISGITANDATGKIVFHLMSPYGAFVNVLALAGTAPVPSSTPMKVETTNPPVGFGPYVIKNVVPAVSYDIVRSPQYAKEALPGAPAGKADFHFKIETNTTTEASDVLNSNADVFDAGDTIPPPVVPQALSQTSRFAKELSATTLYFFLNTKEKPFSSLKARQAVIKAIDRPALAKLASGFLTPGCYLLPPNIIGGHTSQASCPYGDPTKAPDIPAAKKLVQESGMAGTPVTVWSQMRSPRLEYCENLAATLNAIGFKATLKTIADKEYFSTIETLKNHPQIGFADWQQDFPNPTDFYQNLVDANAIAPVGNSNYEEVNDPHIQSELAALYGVPASALQGAAGRWQALDQYLAKQAYLAVYGYEYVPKFYSNKVDFGSAVFHPLYWNDWSTLALK